MYFYVRHFESRPNNKDKHYILYMDLVINTVKLFSNSYIGSIAKAVLLKK